MTEQLLRSWLDTYGRAWETRDPEAVVALFTEDGTYQETPFVEPMRGRSANCGLLVPSDGATHQRSFWLRASGPGFKPEHRPLVVFVRPTAGEGVSQTGRIFVLQFDREGLCTSLRKWWHRQESQTR